MAQRRTVSGLTVVLSYLEIHAGGNGYLRSLVRRSRPSRWRDLIHPRLEISVRDSAGLTHETQGHNGNSSMSSGDASCVAEVSLSVSELPDSGDLEVEVSRISNSEVYIRLASRLYWYLPRGLGRYLQSGWISDALEKALDGAGASWRGPWVFRLRI